jgi:hypothetical protein
MNRSTRTGACVDWSSQSEPPSTSLRSILPTAISASRSLAILYIHKFWQCSADGQTRLFWIWEHAVRIPCICRWLSAADIAHASRQRFTQSRGGRMAGTQCSCDGCTPWCVTIHRVSTPSLIIPSQHSGSSATNCSIPLQIRGRSHVLSETFSTRTSSPPANPYPPRLARRGQNSALCSPSTPFAGTCLSYTQPTSSTFSMSLGRR